jgi:hypothetical protein
VELEDDIPSKVKAKDNIPFDLQWEEDFPSP